MSKKTAAPYRAVMDRILEVLQEVNPGENLDEIANSDFEEAIMEAMKRAFPNGRSRGCWFHFSQAIYRKACEKGLQAAYKSGGVVRNIVKQLIALALLPPANAFEGFQVIQQKNSAAVLSESNDINAGISLLYHYYQYTGGYWFTTHAPSRFYVGDDDSRTNNEVESFNRWFNARCGS